MLGIGPHNSISILGCEKKQLPIHFWPFIYKGYDSIYKSSLCRVCFRENPFLSALNRFSWMLMVVSDLKLKREISHFTE